MVDNLIASVFVLFKHLTNVNAMLPVQLFLFLIIRFGLSLQLFDRLIIQLIRKDNIPAIKNSISFGCYGIVGTLAGSTLQGICVD